MICNLFVLLSLLYIGELASTVAELEESNHKLETLKAERDAAKGAVLPVLNVGSTPIPCDKIRDKQKELQDMESTLKQLMVLLLDSLI